MLLSIAVFFVVNKRNEKTLETAVSTDKLTGLLNRSGFEAAAENLLQQSKGNYTVAAFDIDNFKIINDSFGYVQGDQLLRAIASALKHWKNAIIYARVLMRMISSCSVKRVIHLLLS